MRGTERGPAELLELQTEGEEGERRLGRGPGPEHAGPGGMESKPEFIPRARGSCGRVPQALAKSDLCCTLPQVRVAAAR